MARSSRLVSFRMGMPGRKPGIPRFGGRRRLAILHPRLDDVVGVLFQTLVQLAGEIATVRIHRVECLEGDDQWSDRPAFLDARLGQGKGRMRQSGIEERAVP